MATKPAAFEFDLNMASAPDPRVERLAHAPIRKQAQGKRTKLQGIVAAAHPCSADAWTGVAASMLALIDKGERQKARPAYWAAPFVVVGEGAAGRKGHGRAALDLLPEVAPQFQTGR